MTMSRIQLKVVRKVQKKYQNKSNLLRNFQLHNTHLMSYHQNLKTLILLILYWLPIKTAEKNRNQKKTLNTTTSNFTPQDSYLLSPYTQPKPIKNKKKRRNLHLQ